MTCNAQIISMATLVLVAVILPAIIAIHSEVKIKRARIRREKEWEEYWDYAEEMLRRDLKR